jgi:lipopolysaccharide export system protein LptA
MHAVSKYLVLLCLFSATVVATATTPHIQPSTMILSDTLHYDDLKSTSVFKGHVILTRGILKLYADELQTREDAQGHQYGTALAEANKMVTVRQERPEIFETLQGKGRRVEYDSVKGLFDLIGQAEVIRYICGKSIDTIRGQRIRYDEKSGTYEAIGGKESSGPDRQVRSIIEPRANIEAAIAACRKERAVQKPGTPQKSKVRVKKLMPTTAS